MTVKWYPSKLHVYAPAGSGQRQTSPARPTLTRTSGTRTCPYWTRTCARIKQAFIDEIEWLEPGYIETIRTTRDRCLRPLFELARSGFHSNEDIKTMERVVSVAEQLTAHSTQAQNCP